MPETKLYGGLAEKLYDMEPGMRLSHLPILSGAQLDTLKKCRNLTWDGNVPSKAARNELVDMGLVARWNGFNLATIDGIAVLEVLGMLEKDRG